jgi:hypothetical protein
LFGSTPSAFDEKGEPDLLFASIPDKPWFPFAAPVAFEVKSLPGEYRKVMSRLLEASEHEQAAGVRFDLRLWTAEAVMADACSTIMKAQQSLLRKTPDEYSRNVFLITHPYDHFVPEMLASSSGGSLMPVPADCENLDTLWVYWPPSKLVMWSKLTEVWTDVIFVGDAGTISSDETLTLIQSVELAYIGEAGLEASPYVFNINASKVN